MDTAKRTEHRLAEQGHAPGASRRPSLLARRIQLGGGRHFVAGILAGAILIAMALPAAVAQAPPKAFYAPYASLLEQHVDDRGMVAYRALKAAPENLKAFLQSMERLDRAAFDRWPEKDRVAFWVNAYNALTLKAIIDHYPIKASGISRWRFPNNSIRQIGGVWDNLKFPVMGEDMTLDEIEHQVLRKDYDEPRIHVALVCAAMGCPRLLNEPYVGEKLDEQFADQTRDLLRHPKKFSIDRRRDTVHLSSIFKWFGDDFKSKYAPERGFGSHSDSVRAVLSFISRHVDAANARYLETGDYKVRYLDYDWSLNEQ